MEPKTPHIAILPTPGMGHLIPLVEFAKRLLPHGVSTTFIIPTDGPLPASQKTFLDALPAGRINHLLLPPVSFDDLSDDVRIETRISLTATRSVPALREAVKSLLETANLVALVVDLFGTDALDVAVEFGISPFVFFPSTAMVLSLLLYLPELDPKITGEFRDLPEPVRIPGCIPIHGKDLLDPVQERQNEAYKLVLRHARKYRSAEGIILNSFRDIEPGAIEALQEEEPGKPPVYAIGPLIQTDRKTEERELAFLKWLDDQPAGSVLYVSFGSGGTLSHKQLIELAMGLELCNCRFLWVVRCPNDSIANATYFTIENSTDPLSFLPEGFLERTRNQGLVVPLWAPQAQILAHGSTGGFLTHCGWNSTLESVVCGVPLIAWPLYAEQKMNAVTLVEDLKVALRPKAGENGVVERSEIARVAKGLLEGEEGKKARNKMKELKDAAAKVLGEDGSSTKALSQLASLWKNKASSS